MKEEMHEDDREEWIASGVGDQDGWEEQDEREWILTKGGRVWS